MRISVHQDTRTMRGLLTIEPCHLSRNETVRRHSTKEPRATHTSEKIQGWLRRLAKGFWGLTYLRFEVLLIIRHSSFFNKASTSTSGLSGFSKDPILSHLCSAASRFSTFWSRGSELGERRRYRLAGVWYRKHTKALHQSICSALSFRV